MIQGSVILFLLRSEKCISFFFSSRRRHTRSKRDWSSDVCSSDLPQDDGACDHLRGWMLPSIGLRATSGVKVDLSKEGQPWVVVYCYPRTGRPDQEPLGGAAAWNAIPGARGCTPQSCAYRDHHAELAALGATVYGLSTQDT